MSKFLASLLCLAPLGAGVLVKRIAFVLIATIAIAPAVVRAQGRPAFVEDEVAGVRFGQDPPAQVIKRYGPGDVLPGLDPVLCYCLDRERAALMFRFRLPDNVLAYVFLTRIPEEVPPGCELRVISTTQPVKTGKGIGMGDSPESIIRVYGQPTERQTLPASSPATKFYDLLLSYEGQHERRPGVTQWYSVILPFWTESSPGSS